MQTAFKVPRGKIKYNLPLVIQNPATRNTTNSELFIFKSTSLGCYSNRQAFLIQACRITSEKGYSIKYLLMCDTSATTANNSCSIFVSTRT